MGYRLIKASGQTLNIKLQRPRTTRMVGQCVEDPPEDNTGVETSKKSEMQKQKKK